MNKEKALERLTAIETEAKELRGIIDGPEIKPKEGEVWEYHDGTLYHICGNPLMSGLIAANTETGRQWADIGGGAFGKSLESFTRKGKFNEVFVEIEDVKEALSIKNPKGTASVLDEILSWQHTPTKASSLATRDALKELNIL